MIKVLIADDSSTCRGLLRTLLTEEDGFDVIGEAPDGKLAVSMTAALRPDIVIMDLIMPVMDGLTATAEIMNTTPTPIVIVSASQSINETATAMKALAAGALSVMEKPAISSGASSKAIFSTTVRLMSAIKVIRHRRSEAPLVASMEVPSGYPSSNISGNFPRMANINISNELSTTQNELKSAAIPTKKPKVIAIAASTGGPPALWRIIHSLPPDFEIPIVVVQHIGKGFVDGMVDWLNRGSSGPLVKTAAIGDRLKSGHVLVAPDELHLGVCSDGRIQLSKTGPIGGFRPSANFMFESVAAAFGTHSVGIILTGMGEDGMHGLGTMKKYGGFIVAQDQASSVVFGMPSAAIEAGYTHAVLSLNAIPGYLRELTTL